MEGPFPSFFMGNLAAPQSAICAPTEQAHIAQMGATATRVQDRPPPTSDLRPKMQSAPLPNRRTSHKWAQLPPSHRTDPHPSLTAPQNANRAPTEQAQLNSADATRPSTRQTACGRTNSRHSTVPAPITEAGTVEVTGQPWEASGTSPSWACSKV